MSRRLVLHVGAMKSGTTFVQSTLFANKQVLADRGILLPGQKWDHQTWAVGQFLEHGRGKRWDDYVEQVRRHEGTSVISMEYLGPMRPAMVAGVAEAFGVPIEVVITARDLNRNIASMWQETVQNGRSWTWADYLEGVEQVRPGQRGVKGEVPESGRTFWRQQDLVRMARTWGDVVGRDRVSVVTVPHPGSSRDLLWQRFAQAVGIDPGDIVAPDQANESLGAASALVMRQLNALLDTEGLRFPQGMALRKGLLCKQVLATRKGDEPAIGLPVAPWVRDRAAYLVEGLAALEVRLVGDWSDLEPVEVPGMDVGDVPEAMVSQAAVAALGGVLAEWIRQAQPRG